MAPILVPLLGFLFYGGISPSKIGLIASSLERECNTVQKHVSFYIVKRSPGCFVWATPTMLEAHRYLIMEGQPV
jgi:hypothetical protein